MANLINGKSLVRVAGAAHDLIEHLLQAEQVNDPVGAGHIPNLTVLPTSHASPVASFPSSQVPRLFHVTR